MVGTILPIGYGERHLDRRAVAPWIYAGGAVGAAAAFGALLGLLGGIVRALTPETSFDSFQMVAIGAVAGVYAAREAGVAAIPLPQLQRQVPQWWRRTLPPRAAALAYGIALGPGVGTYVMTGAVYVVVLWCVLSGDAALGAALMSLHAIGKSLPLLALGTGAAAKRVTLAGAAERMSVLEPVMRRAAFVALTAVSLLLILHGVNGGREL